MRTPPHAMTPAVPAELPRSGGILTRRFGEGVLSLLGWRIDGGIPPVKKAVIIVAPHTSNWDFVVGIAAKFALRLGASWLGKDSLFRWPFGVVFRHWGGIPVDRSTPQAMVSQVVARFDAHEQFVVGLAPEGTRKARGHWRSGFWYIAKGAGVPILPVAFDYPSKSIRIAELFWVGDDVEADVAKLKAWYSAFTGRK